MHAIEPHFNWRNLYVASEDYRSPFFEREYSEFEYTNKVYNFLLHPQWDDFGSETLFIKIIFADFLILEILFIPVLIIIGILNLHKYFTK